MDSKFDNYVKFCAELAALLKKYDAVISIETECDSNGSFVSDVFVNSKYTGRRPIVMESYLEESTAYIKANNISSLVN